MIQQIHPHVRVERDSGMCVARGLYAPPYKAQACFLLFLFFLSLFLFFLSPLPSFLCLLCSACFP
jgi:hypothetical protein